MGKYYVLFVQLEDGTWSPEFGDYDRATVEYEKADFRDHGWKTKQLKIVVTDGSQPAIDQAAKQLGNHHQPTTTIN